MAYSDLLKDPRWQKKRLEIFLLEKFPPFANQLRDFLNTNMMIYLQEMKKIEDGIKKGTT